MPALPPQLLAASQSTHVTEANTLGKTGRGYDPASQETCHGELRPRAGCLGGRCNRRAGLLAPSLSPTPPTIGV